MADNVRLLFFLFPLFPPPKNLDEKYVQKTSSNLVITVTSLLSLHMPNIFNLSSEWSVLPAQSHRLCVVGFFFFKFGILFLHLFRYSPESKSLKVDIVLKKFCFLCHECFLISLAKIRALT